MGPRPVGHGENKGQNIFYLYPKVASMGPRPVGHGEPANEEPQALNIVALQWGHGQ